MNGDRRARSRAPAVGASRVGYSDPPIAMPACPGAPGRPRGACPPPDHVRPNVPTPSPRSPTSSSQEHEILARWRERRTFARLRAQNAGGPRWSFLDGPITANNPMGVHHAWGRTYKDLYQRFHAMLGEDQRYQNGFDCQGLWVEVNVERDLGFTSKRDIEAYGIDRVRDPVQAARPDLRRAPDRAVDPPRDVDGLERPGRAAPAARRCSRTDPDAGRHHRGPGRPRHGHRRDAGRAARDARGRRLATSPSATRTTT